MKVIVIGLGNFGMSLAINLSDTGNEVIATDIDREKIERVKDKVAHAVAFDAMNENAYEALPMKNTDMVVVAIGDKQGAAITAAAIVKKMTKAKIVVRASTSIEETILNAMGVEQIIHPEKQFAERFTKTLNLSGSLDNFEIDNEYLVSEVALPAGMIGKTIRECRFREEYELNIVTIIRKEKQRNIFRQRSEEKRVIGMPKPDTVLKNKDVLVVFGKDEHIKAFLEKHNGDDEA
ncbi:MAG TPA: TrkA family potassium uptake protein [Pricia sp.]|nr:TrkA family potassium uptake protein [Pricia sp.]